MQVTHQHAFVAECSCLPILCRFLNMDLQDRGFQRGKIKIVLLDDFGVPLIFRKPPYWSSWVFQDVVFAGIKKKKLAVR